MAEQAFGPVFEVHGGGLDLVFPHHENELAQSRALGHEFARIWTHNGLLRWTGTKMAKSEGNVVTIRDAVDRWGREAVLLFFMTGHWSKPIDFSDDVMAQASAQLETFHNALLGESSAEGDWNELVQALEDDFNTPDALKVLHGWRTRGANDLLRRGLELFGIRPRQFSVPSLVQELAAQRQAAREARDFSEADRLRDEIEQEGWEVRDASDGFQLVPRT